jgi:hypothetical protein
VSTAEDSFTKLLGAQLTDRERQAVFRARDALGIKNNDALWLLLIVLGHYETLFSKVPSQIEEAATDVMEKTRLAAEATMKAAAARAESKLAASVAATAQKIADRRTSTQRWQWVTGGLALAALTLLGASLLGHHAGYSSGHDDGNKEARDENAAADWANTPEGQIAYALAKAGSIRDLAACSGRGWVVKGDFCYPHAEGGAVYGWRIPKP